MFSCVGIIAAFTASVNALGIPSKGGTISVTPHDIYSSSVGVLGCKIDTNRVAYWPSAVDCDKICVRVSANGRSVNLLKIDTSGGAYDIAYDAYNYLVTGKSASEEPVMGGGISATYEDVGMRECMSLLLTEDKTLAFTAANSMNFVTGCRQTESWIGNNFSLFNIANPACTLGVDERCESPDLNFGNQPICPHYLGLQTGMVDPANKNITYGSGVITRPVQ
ncbi:hypothetical protein KC333_g7518 [Hortaea werneckii]|nr:hypothetical protein KC333_g7518 [Hortaea werneckii]KAI7308163.1 hypothetical protein KC326_g7455 [Hortaea werneckii]KAI7554333.1 hypothetical protein KC331_g616 [Hortaea werneckii]KAI7722730.1 hypothetical protein KC353_g249 [Hortaea werneckii]